jgi:hypothetical protein
VIDERVVFFGTGDRVAPHRVPHYRREELGPEHCSSVRHW